MDACRWVAFPHLRGILRAYPVEYYAWQAEFAREPLSALTLLRVPRLLGGTSVLLQRAARCICAAVALGPAGPFHVAYVCHGQRMAGIMAAALVTACGGYRCVSSPDGDDGGGVQCSIIARTKWQPEHDTDRYDVVLWDADCTNERDVRDVLCVCGPHTALTVLNASPEAEQALLLHFAAAHGADPILRGRVYRSDDDDSIRYERLA